MLPPLHRRRDGARDARAQQAHATVALLGSTRDPAWPHGHQGGWQRLSSGQDEGSSVHVRLLDGSTRRCKRIYWPRTQRVETHLDMQTRVQELVIELTARQEPV